MSLFPSLKIYVCVLKRAPSMRLVIINCIYLGYFEYVANMLSQLFEKKLQKTYHIFKFLILTFFGVDYRTIWHRGQFGTADNLAPRTIWHRTIWHRECKADNLAPRTIWHRSVKWTIWHRGQFGTVDNLAPRTIWHRGQFSTVDNLAP